MSVRKDPQQVAEEIAAAIDARIEVTYIKRLDEFVASMETDDQGVSASSTTEEEAYEALVQAAESAGWSPPEAIA